VGQSSLAEGLSNTFALRPTDIEALDQPALDPKNMTDHLIHQYVALKITHDLVNFDDNFPSEPVEKATGATCGSIIAH